MLQPGNGSPYGGQLGGLAGILQQQLSGLYGSPPGQNVSGTLAPQSPSYGNPNMAAPSTGYNPRAGGMGAQGLYDMLSRGYGPGAGKGGRQHGMGRPGNMRGSLYGGIAGGLPGKGGGYPITPVPQPGYGTRPDAQTLPWGGAQQVRQPGSYR